MVFITAEECVPDSDADGEDLVHIPSPESSSAASIRIEQELLEASSRGSNTSGSTPAATRNTAALEDISRAVAGDPEAAVVVDRTAARLMEEIFRPLPVKAAALNNYVLGRLKKASKGQSSMSA